MAISKKPKALKPAQVYVDYQRAKVARGERIDPSVLKEAAMEFNRFSMELLEIARVSEIPPVPQPLTYAQIGQTRPSPTPKKKAGGRPKGSKNKPKIVVAA